MRSSRLQSLPMTWLVASVASIFGISQANAQTPKTVAPTTAAPLTEQKVIERVTAAVDRSLEYLASKQKPDGSWDDCNAGNALAILAMLGRGHVPGRGQYKDVLQNGRRYLLKTQRDDGLFHSRRQAGAGPMYEHGLSTLATAELYGMDPDPDVEEKLRRAVKVIINAQSPNGGWRYNPKPGDHDLSVSVMQIVALRAANNAEIPVPEEVIEKAAKYVRYCAHPNGGYGYQGPAQGPQTSAAGVVSLQLLGKYDDPSVPKTLDLLAKFPVEWSANSIQYWYYFHYYAIQANYQAGGKHWNDWHPRVRELLLDKQNADGSWDVPSGTAENAGVVGPNNIYWTGMASLILEIYMHFLPAYQR